MIHEDLKISELLGSHGWEVVEKRDISYLWVTEIWQIRSKWSPTDCIAYLSFEVDPHNDARDFENVGWMKASVPPPIDWYRDKDSDNLSDRPNVFTSCPLGRRREKYLDSFFQDLAKIRNEWGVTAK